MDPTSSAFPLLIASVLVTPSLRLLRAVRVDNDAWRPFNMASFDQDKVRTYGEFQYSIYWDADKTLVVVRRSLKDHSVQTVRLEGRRLTSTRGMATATQSLA